MYSSVVDPKPNQMMTCPYNMAHQVEHYRMHIHLQKCRKQHPGEKVNCPFDSTHVVDAVELDFHMVSCSKRSMFDSQKYVVEDETTARELPRVPVVATEENWEEEGEFASYVPNVAKKGAHIITKIKGATPSERRKARMEGVKNYRAAPADK